MPNANKKVIAAAGGSAVFSNVVVSGDKVYLAGLIGTDASGKLVEGGVGPETQQAFKNAEARLKHVGLDLSDVISVTIYVNNYVDNLPKLNEVYPGCFPDSSQLPVRAAIGVAALPLNAGAEFSIIAATRS